MARAKSKSMNTTHGYRETSGLQTGKSRRLLLIITAIHWNAITKRPRAHASVCKHRCYWKMPNGLWLILWVITITGVCTARSAILRRMINFKTEQKQSLLSVRPNSLQPENHAKPKGKHRNEKKLDNNQKIW